MDDNLRVGINREGDSRQAAVTCESVGRSLSHVRPFHVPPEFQWNAVRQPPLAKSERTKGHFNPALSTDLPCTRCTR